MKYLAISLVFLVGCNSTDLEKELQTVKNEVKQLQKTSNSNTFNIIKWIEATNHTLDSYGYYIKKHEETLKLMNADGVRVQ